MKLASLNIPHLLRHRLCQLSFCAQPDGFVRMHQSISSCHTNSGLMDALDGFGVSVALLGDLDNGAVHASCHSFMQNHSLFLVI
jgi:hypothetical protein